MEDYTPWGSIILTEELNKEKTLAQKRQGLCLEVGVGEISNLNLLEDLDKLAEFIETSSY